MAWEVVGGGKAGGIVVREGLSLSSAELPERLARGSVIRKLEQHKERLKYCLLDGSGPASGWVSTRMKGVELLQKTTLVINADSHGTGKIDVKDTGKKFATLEEAVAFQKEFMKRFQLKPAPKKRDSKKTGVISLTRAVATGMQDALLDILVQPAAQERIWRTWTQAKGDAQKQEWELHEVLAELSAPVITKLGFEATWDGLIMASGAFVRALGDEIDSAVQVKKQLLLKWCQVPSLQQDMQLTLKEVRRVSASLRHPAAAFAPNFVGGLVGSWQSADWHLEVVAVDSELRVIVSQENRTLRGALCTHDIWHRAIFADGNEIRLRRSNKPQEILVNMRSENGWGEDITMLSLEPHRVVTRRPLGLEAVWSVRKASESWTINTSAPPQDLGEGLQGSWHPLQHLEACNCGPWGWREDFLNMCLDLTQLHLARRGSLLIYASLGSGGLWFDWWLIEHLFRKGYHIVSAHFIDLVYNEVEVRNASWADSALGEMAAWLQACGVRTFAYHQLSDFVWNVPEGAHILAQCDVDCDGVDTVSAMHGSGGLHFWLQSDGGTHGAWMRQGDGVHNLVSSCSMALAARVRKRRPR